VSVGNNMPLKIHTGSWILTDCMGWTQVSLCS